MKASIDEIKALYRYDLASFINFSFRELHPHAQYLHNWHIDVIADKLTQCYERKITRLIINMPPRSLKSICASVAFPAWVLANNPSEQIMCVSYGEELVKDFGEKTRSLMTSERYKALFPNSRVSSRNSSATKFKTLSGGVRQGISAGGQITGRGGDIIIIDDPLKASDINTKERDHINQWFDDNIYQRLNNKNTGVIILVMQRLHEYDLTAHLMAKSDEWELLELRAVAENDESYIPVTNGMGSISRKMGDVLHPERESLKRLNQVKQSIGSYTFAAQYQQNPAADKESLIRSSHFKTFDIDALNIQSNIRHSRHLQAQGFYPIIQSWDTAMKAEDQSDYSVGITIGVKNKQFYIINVIREKLRFKELCDKVIEQRNIYQPDHLIIEDSSAGHHLIQALRDKHVSIEAKRPIGDKHSRLSAISGHVESGLVFLPEKAPWKDDFIMEVTRFPNTRNDDQVDAFTQGMNAAIESTKEEIWVM